MFLIDLNDLAANTAKTSEGGRPAETHLADSESPKHASHQDSAGSPVVKSCQPSPGLCQAVVTKGPSEHVGNPPQGNNNQGCKEPQTTTTECPKMCQPPQDPQESFPAVAALDKTVDPPHVVVEPAPAEAPGKSGKASAKRVSILHAGTRPIEDRVWDQAPGPFVSESLERRPPVDLVVREALSEQHQRCPSPVDAISS